MLEDLFRAFQAMCSNVNDPVPKAPRLDRDYKELMQQRRAIERLTARIGRDERRIADLTCRVETWFRLGDRKAAYRQALVLDDLRQNLAIDRTRLRRQQHEFQEQVTALRQLQQQGDLVTQAGANG